MSSDVSQFLISKRRQIFSVALILAVLGLAGHLCTAIWRSSTDEWAFTAMLIAGPLSSALLGASVVYALFAWKVLRPSAP